MVCIDIEKRYNLNTVHGVLRTAVIRVGLQYLVAVEVICRAKWLHGNSQVFTRMLCKIYLGVSRAELDEERNILR